MSDYLVWNDLNISRDDPVPQVVSRMQAILALGEASWKLVTDYRDTYAGFGERTIIDNAADWHRDSQDLMLLGYLLGFSSDQMDDLFRIAARL